MFTSERIIEDINDEIFWLKSLPLNLKKKNEDTAKLCSNEWSEEDEKHRQWILECLADGKRKVPEFAEQYQAAFDWLKYLRPQSKIHYWTEEEIEPIIGDYLTGKEHYGGMLARLRCLKPKPQWCPSEEELVALKRVGSILRDYGHSELAKMVFMIEGKLANLPVLNKLIWKPSEEQMKHLERCFSHGHTSQLPNQHVLESLYNELKKLM